MAHLPTYLLAIGYVVYWIELYVLKIGQGHTSWLATVLFLIVTLWFIRKEKSSVILLLKKGKEDVLRGDSKTRIFIWIGLGVSFVVLLCALYASLLPPHLVQESDALIYHITLPRQHLLHNSFQYLSWSHFDLYPLPIDFALAPFWLVTEWPNKFPQFLFLLGLLAVAVRLVRHLGKENPFNGFWVIFTILGSHIVGIQIGTAMLDLILCYLFLAGIDSFLEKRIGQGLIELNFFLWSKPLVPILGFVIVILLWGGWGFLQKGGFRTIGLGFVDELEKRNRGASRQFPKSYIFYFLLISVVIGGPFVAKSLYYAGTPIFPFGVGMVNLHPSLDRHSSQWKDVVEKANQTLAFKDQYGAGRSLSDFVLHFWLIAIPEKDVNNRFDYPVGLMYLLFLGPFMFLCWEAFKKKYVSILSLIIVIYWLGWWFGSQQSRFLLIPIVLMFIMVCSQFKMRTIIFPCAILLALVLTAVSIVRAHKPDFGRGRFEVLREKDKQLIGMSKNTQAFLPLAFESPDVAFADFPITPLIK